MEVVFLSDSKPWSYEEIDILYKNYALRTIDELVEMLGRTKPSIEQKARKMGLYHNPTFTQAEKKLAKTLGKDLVFLMPERTISEVEVLLNCNN